MAEDNEEMQQDDLMNEEDEEMESPPEPMSAPEPLPEPAPSSGSKWSWIGSPDRPEAQEYSDGLSDLFEVGNEDNGDDLLSVDIEKDIIDGDLADLTEVSEEDIMGDEETGQIPLDYKPDMPRGRPMPRYRRPTQRYIPPTSMRRSG